MKNRSNEIRSNEIPIRLELPVCHTKHFRHQFIIRIWYWDSDFLQIKLSQILQEMSNKIYLLKETYRKKQTEYNKGKSIYVHYFLFLWEVWFDELESK